LAVSFRSASEDARNTSNPPVPTPPAGVAAGDLLLAVQTSDHRGSLSAMTVSGWTEIGSGSRSDVGFVKVWQRIATASEPAEYEFNDSSSATSNAVVVALTGYDPSQPLVVTPVFTDGSASSTHTAPSVTGTAGGMLLTAHVAGTAGTTRSYTAVPSGMTRAQETTLSSGGYILVGVFYQALAADGATGSKIATCSASRPYVTMSLVVQQPSPLLVSPSSINSTGAFGSPSVSIADADQTVSAVGIASAAAFGSPTVTAPTLPGPYPGSGLYPGSTLFPGEEFQAPDEQTISPVTIPSAEAFGSPVVNTDDEAKTVIVTGIDSDETFPIPTVTVDPIPPLTVETVGLFSAEAFGRPVLTLEIPVPTPTGIDTYFIDGVDLTRHAWAIETAEGLLPTPVPVGDNVALPGRDGELQVFGGLGQPRRADGPGRISFNMWLLGGGHETGYVPLGSTTQNEWFERWDELVRLLHRRQVVIDHARPDGTIRRAIAHLMPDETIEPSRAPGSPWFARFRAVFTIPAGRWTDLTPVTTGVLSLPTNGHVDLSVFAQATAPCTELQVVFGAGNNPRLSTSTGHIGWNGVITSGRKLGIDTATGLTHQASGAAWTPGFEGLTYAPGPRLFEVDPSEPLQGIFTHTTGGFAELEISGKRHYRTS
jgi:hypothetical protein